MMLVLEVGTRTENRDLTSVRARLLPKVRQLHLLYDCLKAK
jgi:hypothetical protein